MKNLIAAIISVPDLDAAHREQMWLLFSRFYGGTSRDRFQSDLAGKDIALLLRDENEALQGFSTLAVCATEFENTLIRVVFSGDTIIARAHWGSQALAFNWLRLAGTLKRQQADVPLYWLLIVKGQRTYRYLPTFAREFIPDWRTAEPQHLRRLKDALALQMFGAAYDSNAGVVRFEQSHGHLTPELANISERESARDDVDFFVRRNPGYAVGDELVCLCELKAENLRPLARRVFLAEATA